MSTSKGRIARADTMLQREAGTPPFADATDLACQQPGIDPEIFWVTEGPGTAAAKDVCRSCPRRDDCLSWAIETDQQHGTWGGKTRAQRVVMRKALTPREDA